MDTKQTEHSQMTAQLLEDDHSLNTVALPFIRGGVVAEEEREEHGAVENGDMALWSQGGFFGRALTRAGPNH